MSRVICSFVLGVFLTFFSLITAYDSHGFSYNHLGADFSVLKLECQTEVYFPDSDILTISIFNATSMMKIAQVLSGKCPTIEDASNIEHLYLPACLSSQGHVTTSLKVLVTNFDSSKVQTFLCNLTKQDANSQVTSVVWAVTVETSESTRQAGTDYTGHIWLPESAYKMIASIQREVKLLEPSFIATGVLLFILLATLSVLLFMSCKIIGYLEYRRPPKLPLSRSQSRTTDRSKSGPLEGDPFYASV